MIVVAGEALVDLVIGVDGDVAAKLGGGPYNVARTIARLGVPVTFLGALSDDRFGHRLLAQLTADGVAVDAVVRTHLPTTLAAAELAEHGAATYRFYLAGTSAPALAAVPPINAPRAVHAGTLGLVLEPMATTLVNFLRTLPDDTLVMLDPNCRPGVVDDQRTYLERLDAACDLADVVKVSGDDAEYLAPGTPPVEYARSLVARSVQVVLLTLGAGGTLVVTPRGEAHVPTAEIRVVDTIGAGDSFGGAFLAWWHSNGHGRAELVDLDLVVRATSAAQEVSAITCQRVGADPPRRAELSARWR